MAYGPNFHRLAARSRWMINNGAIEWKIDEIIDTQFDSRGKLWYEGQWFGYDADENTWEPANALQECAAVDRWERAQRMVC
jgi:hypothetical protein